MLKINNKKAFIPPIFIYIALIALAIWAVSSAISAFGPQFLSIVGSFDAYDTEFDPYSESAICQGIDKEYQIVTETFARNSTLKLSAGSKVRMFCGIGPDIYYDDSSNTVNIGRLDTITDYMEIDVGYPPPLNYEDYFLTDIGTAKILVVFDSDGSVINTETFIGAEVTGCNQSVTRYLESPVEIQAGQEFAIGRSSGQYNSPRYSIPFDYQSIEITAIQQRTGPDELSGQHCRPTMTDRLYFTKNDWPNNQISLTYAVPREDVPIETHYRQESCPLPGGFVLATETFKSGSTVSAASLRYTASYFCKRHPVLITKTSDSSTKNCPGASCTLGFDPYEKLVAGQALQVGQDETWTLFYVIDANQELPIVCDVSDSTYDVNLGKCVQTVTGVLHVCSEGNFDPATGLCLVQADTEYACEFGRYDVAQQKCIYHPDEVAVCELGELSADNKSCIYTPDLHKTCPEGSYDESKDACVVSPDIEYLCINGVYDKDKNICVIAPAEMIFCRDGFAYDQALDKCVQYPESAVKCLDGYTYDPAADECQMIPEHDIECPDNTRYEKGKCVYEPDVVINCPADTQYDSSLNKCVVTDHIIVCNDGYAYDDELGACVKQGTIIGWYDAFLIWLGNLFS